MDPSAPAAAWQIVHHIPGRMRLRLPVGAGTRKALQQHLEQLEQLTGVRSARLNRAAQSIAIVYCPTVEPALLTLLTDYAPAQRQPSEKAAIRALQQPDPDQASPAQTSQDAPEQESPDQDSEDTPTSLGDALDELEGVRLPLLTAGLVIAGRLSRLPGLRSLAWVTLAAAMVPVARRAVQSLTGQLTGDRKFNIDCLDLLALSLSAVNGKVLTPALVLALHELGDTIREQTARTTAVQTADLEDAIGRYAWIKGADGDPPVQIPSDRVQVGQIVVVYPGEQIPVDGQILRGEATIDQQSLTGEAMPIVGRSGVTVYASTLVRSGEIEIRADRVAANTRAAAGLALLRDAPVHDTRMANYAEQVADRLILPSLLLAGVVLFTTRDPARAAAILTLDFVTGVRVSIPMAFLGALNHTTRHGVLIRSGRTLEKLAEVDTIVFDKTGTLTQGRIAVVEVRPYDRETGLDGPEILRLAASAEQRVNHPIAEAIVNHALEEGLSLLNRQEWSYEVGLGI
ncbi:MAG: HAD-IC family P-type ATPase, partial [Cyanobacteria bacterium P01_H01_bin.130]